jgi:hypothetical protein
MPIELLGVHFVEGQGDTESPTVVVIFQATNDDGTTTLSLLEVPAAVFQETNQPDTLSPEAYTIVPITAVDGALLAGATVVGEDATLPAIYFIYEDFDGKPVGVVVAPEDELIYSLLLSIVRK